MFALRKILLIMAILALFFVQTVYATQQVKGIYISQTTLENRDYLSYLIQRAKQTGINTFIIDFNRMSKAYTRNIQLVKANNLRYVARIVVFPDGGTDAQIKSEDYRERKLQQIRQAIAMGAQEIQLDYIRYNSAQPASHQNARNVHEVIRWFKSEIKDTGVPLQVAVFGIASFGEEVHIGQNIPMFADTVDVVCPMVYPSHYEPFRFHATRPYETIFGSLDALKKQFPREQLPVKLYPYIELSNYRYPLSTEQRYRYIQAQIKATKDAGADGWYAWSPSNRYDNLFRVLQTSNVAIN